MQKGKQLREKMLEFIVSRYEDNRRQFFLKMKKLHLEIFSYGKSSTMNGTISYRNEPLDEIHRTTNRIIYNVPRIQRRLYQRRVIRNGMELQPNYSSRSPQHIQQTQYFHYDGYHQSSHLKCNSYRYAPY